MFPSRGSIAYMFDATQFVKIDLQHNSPGKELESNWLLIPAGPFWATLRLYGPKPEVLNKRWKQPPLERGN